MGANGEMLRAALNTTPHGLRGVVVEGFAGGDVTRDLGAAIGEATAAGIAVVLANCGYERPGSPSYDGVGEGVWLVARGVVRAPGISTRQARLLLMTALAQEGDDWATLVRQATS